MTPSAADASAPDPPDDDDAMRPYLWALLAMLASATFFEGFEAAILSAVAPFVQAQYGLDDRAWGLVVGLARTGAVLSFVVLVWADRYGRRRLITLTILGYALCTGATALSQSIESFTAWQLGARIFLASEFALALIIIGEEFPTRRRSMGIAILTGVAAVGTIVAFLSTGWVLARWDWRAMYLLGLIPLALVFLVRLGMRETRRFQAIARGERPHPLQQIRQALAPAYRPRVLLVTGLWNCNHLLTSPATTFWTIHAARTLGYDAGTYGMVVATGFLAGFAIGSPLAAWLMDHVGRRRACAILYIAAGVAITALFWTPSRSVPVQMVLMSCAAIAALGASAVTSTYATELFPTAIRATAYGVTTNLFGRVLEFGTPMLIGTLAVEIGIPGAVAIVAGGPILGGLGVLRWAPETRGLTLEEIEVRPEPAPRARATAAKGRHAPAHPPPR